MACEILVSGPEIKPTYPELAGRFLTTGPPGKSLILILNKHKITFLYMYPQIPVVQSLLCLILCDPTDCARQASLSSTISWSSLKFMSIESVMPSNHFILCCPLLLLPSIFPSIGSFSMSWLFASGGQRIGASASASLFLMNIRVNFL